MSEFQTMPKAYRTHLSIGYLNDLVEYDPLETTWTQLEITGQLPQARMFPGLAVSGSLLCLFGGNTDYGEPNIACTQHGGRIQPTSS